MAATVFPAPSAAQLTDQGGTVVLARFKTGNVAITSAQLSAGTYFLTGQGSGLLTVRAYTGSTSGGAILNMSINGSTTSQIVVPAGVSGLTFEGTYNGPLVFQTIASASAVTFGAATIQVDLSLADFSSSSWRPIPKSPYYITWNNGYSSIANLDTGSIVTQTSGTRPVYAYNQSYINGGYDTLYGYNPSTGTIVFANGYGSGSYNAVIYRTTNLGLSWSTPQTNLSDNYAYWDAAQFVGNNFYVACGTTGTGSLREYFYVSTNDGASWTFVNLGSEKLLRKFGYNSDTQTYYGFCNQYISGSPSTSWLNRVYNLGSSGTSLSSTTTISMNNPITVWSDFVPTSNGVTGAFYAIDQYARLYKWDGTTFSVASTSLEGSYYGQEPYGKSGFENSYVNIPTDLVNASAIPYFAGKNSSGYGVFMFYNPKTNSASASQVTGGIFSSASNYPDRCSNLSLNPTTNQTRIGVFKDNIGNGYQNGGPGGTPLSPSGFSGKVGNFDNQRSYFSEKFQKAYFISSDPNNYVYRSENATKLVPSIAVYNNGDTKSGFYETTETLFFPWWNGSMYINRTFDGINFESPIQVPGVVSWLGYNQVAVLGKTIVVWNGNTVGANNTYRVSIDQGSSWFAISQPATGNTSDVMRVFSDGNFIYSRASNSGKLYRTADGLSWTDTGTTWSNLPYWQTGTTAFSSYTSGNSTQYFYPGNSTAEIAHTNPNSSYNWTPVKFGSGYALLYRAESNSTQLNYFYSSDNGVSWTQRTVLNNRRWSGGFGSDNFAVIQSSYETFTQRIITSRTVTVS